ncbi:histidinol-phosphate phosphatase family protein [Saccharothrix tamanrassetensis]|uniref:D,D-heptose 1,7-bisphosphate phosphatase n=1 Tax=Saccharothrix tamanrassetensis TaxID=1051531 RepID=A0A841CWC3_9PSEU|nr:HAD family hydrolase [Saccharothrix tamanrassetensis]MBB5960255.1 histidinol-phosphate phosphatase family protein [Saccharothrix tamanrassetensis]
MDQYPQAVLFDRDGTLIRDVPYNGDPSLVTLMPGALETVRELRAQGVRTGVVSNQSGIGRGLLSWEDVAAVNARVEQLLGRFGTWQLCPHHPDDGCACRKPQPGLVLAACEALDVEPSRTVVIGDIGADVDAARAAGASSVLVPTPRTLRAEIDQAPCVAKDLAGALEAIR